MEFVVNQSQFTLYTKTSRVMTNQKWFESIWLSLRTLAYADICNNLIFYIRISICVPGQNEGLFLEALEWLCFMLLQYNATMVQISRMPESYWFDPNSKFQSQAKVEEWVELSRSMEENT